MQQDGEKVKLDIHCNVQGDVVLECLNLDADLDHEESMFRAMFNTAFISDNVLKLKFDDMDVLWDRQDQYPKEFLAEVLVRRQTNHLYLTFLFFFFFVRGKQFLFLICV